MEATSAKRIFYEWVIRWISSRKCDDQEADLSTEEWDRREKPDVTSIACLLQAVGFKLRSFEKVSNAKESEKVDPGKIKVSIECGTSNMMAILEMERMKCKCMNFDDKDASFWSISGTGPSGSMDNVNKVDETGSNLLPLVSKNTAVLLRDVTFKLFKIIEGEPDVNRNTRAGLNNEINKAMIGIARSQTEPEIKRGASNVSSTNLSNTSLPVTTRKRPVRLIRQETWNVDEKKIENDNMEKNLEDEPRPSPPKITSSPAVVGELCNSLGQISLQSDDQDSNVTAYLVGAYRHLGKALGILLANKITESSKCSLYGTDESEPSRSLETIPSQDPVIATVKLPEPVSIENVAGMKPITSIPSVSKVPKISPIKSKIGILEKSKRKSFGSFANDLNKESPRPSQTRGQIGGLKLTRRRTMGVPSSMNNSNSSVASGNSLKMDSGDWMKNKGGKQAAICAELTRNKLFATARNRNPETPGTSTKPRSGGGSRTPSMLPHSKFSENKRNQGKTPQPSRIPSPKITKSMDK